MMIPHINNAKYMNENTNNPRYTKFFAKCICY